MATSKEILSDYIASTTGNTIQNNPRQLSSQSPYVQQATNLVQRPLTRQQQGDAIYQQLKDQQAFSLGGTINPLASGAYKNLITEQRAGTNVLPDYEKSSTTYSKSKGYVDDMRDFTAWAKTLYGYDADIDTNFQTLAKQYNYSKDRASRDLFQIEFSDPSYDPDQYSTLQNEYYQYATQEMPKKGDPRMAQYNFPVWINKQYPTDIYKVDKERAALLGVTYVKDMVVPKYNNDAQYYTNLGTPYGIDEEDQKRKIYALPPRSFIELYGPGTANYTDRVMSQEAPQVLTNTQKFSDDYQSFMAERQKLIESDNVSFTNIQNLYDKYPTFSAMDDYYADVQTHNDTMVPGSDGYDAYNAKVLAGTYNAPTSPIMDSTLQKAKFSPTFVDDTYKQALAAQTQIQQDKKAQEGTFWDKLKDFIQGSSNDAERFQRQITSAARVINPDITTYDEAIKTHTAKATAQAQQLATKEKKDDELATANASILITNLKKDTSYQALVSQGKGITETSSDKATQIMATINNPAVAAKLSASAMVSGGNEVAMREATRYTFVTDDEANALRYYYGKGDMSGFNNYLASISDQLDKRYVMAGLANIQKAVDKKGPGGEIAAASMSVAYGLAAPAAYIDTLFKSNIGTPLASEKINRYSAIQSIALMANQTRQAAGSTSTPTGQFFINTGLSIVDQVVKLPFGPTGALVWMAASAAGTATATALQNGATPLQAAQYGTIYGAIEYATERLPIDNLFKLIDPAKYATGAILKRPTLITAIKAALHQAGLEGKEELIAEYADQLTDIAIMGDKSAFWQYVGSLTAGGMDETEAFNRGVVKFFIEQPVVSFAGGWLAGAVMGGGAIGSNYSQMNVLYNQQQQSTMPPEGVQAPQSVTGAEVGNPSTADAGQVQMPVTDATQATDVAQATPVEQAGITTATESITDLADTNFSNSAIMGNKGHAFTADNKQVDFVYAIVPVESLVTSHDEYGKINESYPAELQPRDRARTASLLSVTKIYGNPNVERLVEDISVQNGAPIVGQDGYVESGNGRTIAIDKLYRNGKAENYKQYILSRAASFGIDTSSVPDNPVLVRIRTTDLNRASFANKANMPTNESYSSLETAIGDAKNMSDDLISLFVLNDSGKINTRDNREFITRFVGDVIPEVEYNKFVTKNGELSSEGLIRMKNALFQKAYNSSILSERYSELVDMDAKNIVTALLKSAPSAAELRTHIDAGTYYPLNFVDDVSQTAEIYVSLKDSGMTVPVYLAQYSFFDKDVSPIVKTLLSIMEANRLSASKLNTFINILYDSVRAYGNPKQTKNAEMSEDHSNITKEATLYDATERFEQETSKPIDVIEVNVQPGDAQTSINFDKSIQGQKGMGKSKSATINPNGIRADIATQSQTNNVPAIAETQTNIPQSAINTRVSTQNATDTSPGVTPQSNVSPKIRADVNSAVSYAQKNGNAQNAKPLSVIVQTVKDWLGSPVNTAIFKRPKGSRVTAQMQGWYQDYQDVIGVKTLYELPTLFHEIGHRLDAQYGLSENANSLRVNYLTDRVTKNYKPEEHASEMVADFFRDYFLNPDIAKQKAPEFFASVESKLSSTDNTQIANVRQMLADFATQTVAEKLKSQIVTQQQPQSDAAKTAMIALKKLEMGFFDEVAPVMDFGRLFNPLVGDFAIHSKYSSDVADNIIHNKLFAPPKLNGDHGDTLVDMSFEGLFKFLEKLPNPREMRQVFISYLVAEHAIERAAQGKEALPTAIATTEELVKQVAEWDEQYPYLETAVSRLHKWWNAFIQSWLVDAGLWDQKTFDMLKEMYPNYVPFYRQLSSGAVSYGKLGPKGFSGILAPIKGAHKSDLPILDPIASMMDDIHKYVQTFNNRMVMIQIVKGFDEHPEGMNEWLIEVSPLIIADKLRLAEVKDIIATGIQNEFGKTEDDSIRFLEEVLPGEYTTIFRKRRMSDGVERNILTLKDSKGTERFFYSENSLFFEGLAGLSPEQAAPLMRGLAKITNLVKSTITYMNPFFAAPNVAKDFQERIAWGSHTSPVQLIGDTKTAMIDIIKGSELWDIYGQMGGKGQATSYNFDVGSRKSHSADIMPYNTLSRWERAQSSVTVPLKGTEAFNNYCEQINRYGEFISAERSGVPDVTAMGLVHDVTVNFRRKGKWAKNLDPLLMFYNAQAQDYYKLIRLMRDSTGKARTKAGVKLLAKVFIRFLVSQSLIGFLEALLHGNDKDYKDLPSNIKDAYWILWKVNGVFLKLPKPASVVPIFFSSVTERATEYLLQGNKQAFEGFGTSMQAQITPSFILAPLIAIGQNATWYGGSIENAQDLNVDYLHRFDESTSSFAKTLSNVFGGWAKNIKTPGYVDGLSPKEFQYLIDQYTGVLGDIVLPWTNISSWGSGMEKLVSSRFLVDPVLSNKQMSDFYDYSDAIEEANNTVALSGESRRVKDVELFPSKAKNIIDNAIHDGDRLLKNYKVAVNKLDAMDLPKAEHAQEARRLRNDLNDQLREINKELVDFKTEFMK